MRMSKGLTVRIGVLIAVVLAGMVAMGVLLTGMQGQLTRSSYAEEIEYEEASLPELLEQADAETVENTAQFDAIYQSKAASVAFMAQNDAGFEVTDAKMAEYRELLAVDNVMVVTRTGEIVARATDTPADFTRMRFNRLRDTFDTNEPSEAVEIEYPEEEWLDRYYAARIDDETMVVIEQNPAELRDLVESTGSLASVLGSISLGQDGYVFAVSAKDYVIEYHPDEDLVGADAIDAGLSVENLEDGTLANMTLDGEALFCGVTKIGDMYYISAVPEADMAASSAITVDVILFAFFVVIAAVTLYGIFVLRDDERRGHRDEDCRRVGPVRLNRAIAGRALVLAIVGFLGILIISFYMQSLFALSSQSLTLSERADSISQTIERSQASAAELEEQYGERYLSKAETAAYILEQNPSLATREKLGELADILQVQYLFTFNDQGVVTATNSSYTNFVLSEDPADQSFEFRKLLQGVDHVVQDAMPDEISGELRQYIGVTTHDATGQLTGFVQLGIRPTRLENLLESVQIDHVLDGVQVGADGFAFAVSKVDGTIAYYPDQNTTGKDAAACGITENQLRDGFSDYITVNGDRYYASVAETSDYYVFVVAGEGALMNERGPLTIATGAIALVCLIVVFALISVAPSGRPAAPSATSGGDEGTGVVEVNIGGRRVRSDSAVSRWLGRSFDWDDLSPERKVGCVLRWFAAVAVVVVCGAVIFKDSIFDKRSLLAYILGGTWEHGLNIFAITASIMFACVLATVAAALQKILQFVSRVLDARGVTMRRLISSVVKYASVIGMLYWCLALIGVDTATLLASAGLLTFAVSLGAKDIVTDIISGLFIIFEGEFRVGDIIQVGGQRGTVMEIGVRTTKINDGSGNILVLRNSSISNVVNMTKEHSYAAIEVGIEYGESLERVEAILSRELPEMKKRLPAIIEGPFYKGVSMLADNSVNIKIVAECAESDRGGLTSDLLREMKLLFDVYDISIPYPQVVVNQPIEF